jgi:uncharacterized membrane protein
LSEPKPPAAAGQDPDKLRLFAHAVYALQALGFLTLITPLVGVIIDYVKLDDSRGSVYEAHYRWQIRTFWWTLLWSLLGALTWVVFIGMAILFLLPIWYIYRIVKGWLRLSEGRPV